jgi:membrane protein YqaA with SNARE-associated domain
MKTVKVIASTLGGYAGWWLGNYVGLGTAFFLSVVGTALGVYLAHHWMSEYLS